MFILQQIITITNKKDCKGKAMSNVTKEMALDYHKGNRPGKIETVPTKPYSSQKDLSLAYSPGVA